MQITFVSQIVMYHLILTSVCDILAIISLHELKTPVATDIPTIIVGLLLMQTISDEIEVQLQIGFTPF